MSADQLMLQAADALEKLANYVEQVETGRVRVETESRRKQASVLANQIANTVGEQLDDSLVDKLASLNPDVQSLLNKLTGGDAVDSLGGPTESSKVASVRNALPSADARFMDWVTND